MPGAVSSSSVAVPSRLTPIVRAHSAAEVSSNGAIVM